MRKTFYEKLDVETYGAHLQTCLLKILFIKLCFHRVLF